ncbi:MAG: hypothetical protein U0O22_01160 [Acutalibacteraceae bacterium]
MEIIAKVFAEQWIFMLIAAAVVTMTFLVKKKAIEYYQTYLKGGLILLVVATVVLALLFHLPDLFLLIPIIVMCCELFGYDVTGKIVAVLFVDFLLIQVDYRFIPNETAMTIIFYALQIASAVCIGIIMDKYLRETSAESKKTDEAPKQEAVTDNKESKDEDEIDVADLFETTSTNPFDDFSEEALDMEIEKIMSDIE